MCLYKTSLVYPKILIEKKTFKIKMLIFVTNQHTSFILCLIQIWSKEALSVKEMPIF